ncbi:PKD domain-containing protein, partial [Candidatus Amoebophilus asiaticus]|nr:PKD domain-containing protein [Candidatus Amoebophilus asiaticus]
CVATYCEILEIVDTTVVSCYADFSFFPDTLNILSFSNLSNGTFTNLHWDFGDGTVSGAYSPSHDFVNSGYYDVCLTVYDSVSSCMSSICQNIKVGEDTLACFIYADFTYFPFATSSVYFNNESFGFTHVYWDLGDGYTSTDNNPNHTYSSPGFYQVCIAVFDSATQCLDSYCDIIQVGSDSAIANDCYADFTFYPDVNNDVYFTNESSDAANIHWDFGDGSTLNDTASVVYHMYATAGYYDVCLTIYDTSIQCIETYCVTVQVGADSALANDCNADFSYYIDANYTVIFSDESQGTFTDWYWDFDDGDNSNLIDPSHTYINTGYYDVCLTVYNTVDSCMDTRCEIIQIVDSIAINCNAYFTYMVDSATQTVVFNDVSTGDPDAWYWNFGDFSIANTQQHPTNNYSQDGYYEVCLTIYKGNDCQETYCQVIAVGDVSNSIYADFTYYTDSVTSTAYFNNLSLGSVVEYYWQFGDGQFSIYENPAHSYPLDSGWYMVCLTVKNASQIQDMTCKNINIYSTLIDPCLFSCVWPGNANYLDLEANHYDLLFIGLNYGNSGPARDSLSSRWIGHYADDWASVQLNGVNSKHSDCNGDGIVDLLDVDALASNFAYSHPYQPGKKQQYNPANPDLYFEVITPNVAPGVDIEVKIMAGKDSLDLYGIAYEVGIDMTKIQDQQIIMQYDSSWLGTAGSDMLTYAFTDTANNLLLASLSRNNQGDQYGFGEIARMSFTIDPNASVDPFIICITTDYGVNALGDSLSFNTICDTLKTGIRELTELQDIVLYPNPSAGVFTCILPQKQLDDYSIVIYNSLGQLVFNETYNTGGKVRLDISNYGNGLYFLQIKNANALYQTKLELIK